MPRQSRALSSTGIYHVMMRGIDRQNIFRDNYDRLKFLQCLESSKKRMTAADGEYELYAYALMGNHFHLLIRVVTGSLGDFMKKLACGYVLYFNKKYHRDGHLFKERFRSEICEDEDYFLTLLRYIHQNPIKSSSCVDLMKYRYTSWEEYKDPENCAVKICDCDYVLQRLPLDELEKLIYDMLPDNAKCIDTDKSRGQISDSSIVNRLKAVYGQEAEELKNAPFNTRKEVLCELLNFGASISQLSRLFGVSKSVVSKLKS